MAAKPGTAYLQDLLDKHRIDAHMPDLLKRWSEFHRVCHNTSHLDDLLQQITSDFEAGNINLQQKEALEITALFHDIIYNPAKEDNEQQSAQFFLDKCREPDATIVREVYTAILDTQKHENSTPLATIFNKYDMNIVEQGFSKLLEWEFGIYNEYRIFGNMIYKAGRLQFLQKMVKQYPANRKNLEALIGWVMMNY